MNNPIHILLQEYGLNDKEIALYVALAGSERLTAYALAKQTKIHRSTAYDALARLIKNGFVGTVQEKSTSYYFATSPSRLMTDLKSKQALLEKITEELRVLHQTAKTVVEYSEGVESQKQFNIDILDRIRKKAVTEVLVLGNGPSWTIGNELLIDKLIKEFKQLRIRTNYRAIWDPQFRNKEIARKFEGMGKQRYLQLPTKTTTVIAGDMVAFLYTTDSPQVIRIQEKNVADEMRAYFEHLWKLAKK